MKKATSDEYIKIAEGFYKHYLSGEPPTAKRLKSALLGLQQEFRPNYWRKLKIAIAHDQEQRGYKDVAEVVRGLVNQVAKDAVIRKDYSALKPRLPRVKRLKPDDKVRIAEALKAKGDQLLADMYRVCEFTGCRPVEVASVRVSVDEVMIAGAKVNDKRGVKFRTLRGFDEMELALLKRATGRLRQALLDEQSVNVGALQDRFDRLMKKTFPRRKHKPTLYTLRHQFGSNLKASGMSREAIAVCMGHRSTSSADTYGDRRTGSKGFKIEPGKMHQQMGYDEINSNHSAPPQKPNRLENPSKKLERGQGLGGDGLSFG